MCHTGGICKICIWGGGQAAPIQYGDDMKRIAFTIASVILALMISVVAYVYIFGGKPQIENFTEVSNHYAIVAELALNTYSEIPQEEEYMIIYIYDGNFKYDSSNLLLTEEQQNAALTVRENFEYLRICKDAVFFHEDETGYYGLVYAKHPLSALYAAGFPQEGRQYHRINRHWYEWGVWGI